MNHPEELLLTKLKDIFYDITEMGSCQIVFFQYFIREANNFILLIFIFMTPLSILLPTLLGLGRCTNGWIKQYWPILMSTNVQWCSCQYYIISWSIVVSRKESLVTLQLQLQLLLFVSLASSHNSCYIINMNSWNTGNHIFKCQWSFWYLSPWLCMYSKEKVSILKLKEIFTKH